jgi:hypothetical protein
MQNATGDTIISSDSGKSDPDATVKSDDRIENRISDPEIINGIEVESGPDTERIGDANTGGEPRRNKDGTISKRRGRKPGSRSEEKESLRLSSISLETLLYSIHAMGAEFLACKELELEKDEAKKLADAVQEVGKYYNVSFDPKKVAIVQLAVVAGGIYGPMFVQIRRRLKAEKIQRPPVPINRPQQEKQAQTPSRPLNEVSPSEIWNETASL